MSYELTKEQKDIVELSRTAKVLKIEAFAGSGKSSTLAEVAKVNQVPSLYLTFNKAMAMEAKEKFPSHVDCRTIHSVAYSVFGREYQHKLSRPKGGYKNVAGTASEIAKFYKVKPVFTSDDKCAFSSVFIGLLALSAVARFEQSSDTDIKTNHTPYRDILEKTKKYPDVNVKDIQKAVLNLAKNLWDDRVDLLSPVLATHDTYLKLYQLSKPKLNFDMLYIDEAQDVNDVMIDIVVNQDCRKVFVGDSYQSIYKFRGAINALSKIQAPTLPLTTSFRFGDDVANVANGIIKPDIHMKGFGKSVVKGFDEVDFNNLPKGAALIFRTNMGLFLTALELIEDGFSLDMPNVISSIKSMITSALALRKGDSKNVKHSTMIPFSDWQEFEESAQDDPELKRVYNITKEGESALKRKLAILANNDSRDPDFILTTAHGSKGLEWNTTVVMNDFKEEVEVFLNDDQERNLLYVASTRSKEVLYINGVTQQLLDISPRDEVIKYMFNKNINEAVKSLGSDV